MEEHIDERKVSETLIDAHVHLRGGVDVKDFLLASLRNFRFHGKEAEKVTGVLCVTDERGERGYDRLERFVNDSEVRDYEIFEGWKIVPTAENVTLSVVSASKERLVIVAGRQLVSQEGLEVLAVGTRKQFGSKKPAETLIRDVAQEKALPILPWGFGKWRGARGRLLGQLLRNSKLSPLFLGDSANRPELWPRPDHFRQAEKQGVKNIPGSDPLPLPGEVMRIGNFGGRIYGCLDLKKPANDLIRRLLDSSTTIEQFGSRETFFRFVRNQVLIRYRSWITHGH